MNFEKIERIASQLEAALGIDDAGDEIIDKAEDAVAQGEDTLPELIDDNIEEEKVNSDDPIVTEPAPLEASDDDAKSLNDEIDEDDDAINELDETNDVNKDIVNLESQLDNNEVNDENNDISEESEQEIIVEAEEGEECDSEGAKACIASMTKLIKIAKAVKMSKDIPATKKEEVLGKIQKASEKLRKGAFGDSSTENSTMDKMTNTNSKTKTKDDASSKFLGLLMNNRQKLTKLISGSSKGMPINTLLPKGVMGITTVAGKLTPLQLIHIFEALLNN